MSRHDFVISIATVNGTGSQSANNILLRSLFRMGVPVGGKNVFPSNIAGLPTWFWIRANQKGFVGQAKKADICVNLNATTLYQDMQSLNEGGFFFYNSDSILDNSKVPAGIKLVPVPFKKLSEDASTSVKTRKLLINMVYVGILSQLLKLENEVVKACIKDQLGYKESVFESNLKAFEIGQTFALENLMGIGFDFESHSAGSIDGKIIIDGNTAAALGCIAGGCTFLSWYPITPSSSLAEAFIKYAPQLRKTEDGKNKFGIVQSEDELAAICMVLGAGWTGARAMTATSGPGVSLMAEAAGFSFYAEIPAVIWDVQRSGPSTGMPTRTQQSDLIFAHFLSHGGTRHPVLLPANVQECFEFGQTCFDLAEHLQTLILVLSDLDLGMNLWISDEFNMTAKPYQRGKILTSEMMDQGIYHERYKDVDGDGVPFRTLPGNPHPKAAYFTRGSGHNSKGQYTEDSEQYFEVLERLNKKWETAKTLVPKPVISKEDASKNQDVGVLYFGSTEFVVPEARHELKSHSILVDTCRVKALPFCQEVEQFLADHKTIFVIDQNKDGQMKKLLSMEFPLLAHKLQSVIHFTGTPITAENIYKPIISKLTKEV